MAGHVPTYSCGGQATLLGGGKNTPPLCPPVNGGKLGFRADQGICLGGSHPLVSSREREESPASRALRDDRTAVRKTHTQEGAG